MKSEVLSTHLPVVPSFAVYSRRYDVVYSGSPFTTVGTSHSPPQAPRLSFQGHADAVCISRDERNVAISSSSLIKLYDVDTGREIRNLAAHSLPVHAICPRRNSIYNWFSGSLDASWIMWDIRCHPAKVLDGRATGPIRCLDISPDDSILAVGTDSALQLYDVRNRQLLNRFGYSTVGVTYNPAEKLLASFGLDRIVRFICIDQMECVSVSDPFYGEIRGISFAGSSPETDFLVASTDSELRILTWEPCDTLSSCQLPPGGHHVLNVSLSEDSVDLISYNVDGAFALVSYSIEEVLTGEILPASSPEDSPVPSTPSPPCSEHEEDPLPMPPVVLATPPLRKSSEKLEIKVTPTKSRKPPVRAGSTNERLKAKEKSVVSRPRSPSASCLPPSDPFKPKTLEESTPLRNTRSQSNSRVSLAQVRAPSPAVKSEKKPLPSSRKASPTEEKKPFVKTTAPIDAWINKIENKHKKSMKESKLRLQNISQAETAVKRFGLEEAVGKEVAFYDSFILQTVLTHYNSEHLWDVGLVHKYLPRIKELLDGKDSVDCCLESLERICDGLLEKLMKNAAYQSSIGVDVAAEERKEKSIESIKIFRQLRDSHHSYYKKLSEDDALRLDSIISRLKKL